MPAPGRNANGAGLGCVTESVAFSLLDCHWLAHLLFILSMCNGAILSRDCCRVAREPGSWQMGGIHDLYRMEERRKSITFLKIAIK